MLKKWLCFILTISLCAPLLSTVAFAAGSEIDGNLVAHWDFEGETVEEKLSDKSSGGAVNDKLTEYYPNKGTEGVSSPITLENGSAYIPHDVGVQLAAENSADLHSFTEYTLYTRMSMSGTGNGFADFIHKNGLVRFYVSTGNANRGYTIQFRQNGRGTHQVAVPSAYTVKADQMISLAVAVKQIDNSTFSMVLHFSGDGKNWASTAPETFTKETGDPSDYIGTAASLEASSKLAIGKFLNSDTDRGINYKMYDVRIYNKALSNTDVATIPQTSSGELAEERPDTPTVPTVPSFDKQLLAYWSFDETRGDTARDSVGDRTATLVNASFDKGIYPVSSDTDEGITGNGVLIDSSKNGRIDFGERGIAQILEGKSAYTVSMWILPCYYDAKNTMRLLTIGADESGKALLDIHWSKNNATERKGVSISVRSDYGENGKTVDQTYTLPESAINIKDGTSNTFGVWQMLTVTVDYTSRTCKAYINDREISSFTFTASKNAFSSGSGKRISDTIGFCSATPSYMAFNGYIDEFRIYEGALTGEKVASLTAQYRDTNSPTADQKLVDALIARLGDAAVLYTGGSNVLMNGFTVKLDPDDYTKKPYIKRNELYAPSAFAKNYFGGEISADDSGYVNISALAKERGYSVYSSVSRRLAIILPDGVESFDDPEAVVGGYTNEQYLDRLVEFFDNPYQPEPLCNAEQSRTVVFTSTAEGEYVYSPSICTLDGVLYASCDIKSEHTRVFRSKDGGVSWEQVGKIDGLRGASIFAYDGKLYLLGTYVNTAKDSIGICGTRNISESGVVWSAVSSIHCDFIEKSGHCAPTPVLFANGRAYMAFEDGHIWGVEVAEASPDGEKTPRKAFVVSCDLKDNLMNGSNWVCSNYISITADWYKSVTGATVTPPIGVPALEGNMVQAPDGTIYNILRFHCEPQKSRAVMLRVSADGRQISIPEENALLNFPGGDNKFSIYYDESTGYYMSLVNNNTAPYWDMQRNVLSLSVSRDLINWEIVETVLVDRTMLNFDVSMATHAFQYVDWCIDGEDIVFTVRETMGDTEFYHNGYEMTFYRLTNYKQFLTDVEEPDESPEAPVDTGEVPAESASLWDKILSYGDKILSYGGKILSNKTTWVIVALVIASLVVVGGGVAGVAVGITVLVKKRRNNPKIK